MRFAGHCWRSKHEIISDVLLWEPKHGYRNAGRPSKTFVKQLYDDSNILVNEDLSRATEDRELW